MARMVALTADEALVLLDWLSRHDEADDLPHSESEQRVLWNLEAALEKVVPEIFEPNYRVLVEQASARLLNNQD
ncbi:MAG: hypothetical protein Q4P15_12695 [Propionibacteriaceae bacterium]|nr:hypothetical protein [Propionibacteriaceae bacterium]